VGESGDLARTIRSGICIVLLVLACTPQSKTVRSPAGLWVWHEQWLSAPDWLVKESGPQWNAPGIVLRFCPNGRFRMASGVFYRGGGHMTLGSSDGLALYEGSWVNRPDGVTVTYRLVDSEIRFSGMEKAMATEWREHLGIAGDALLFTFHRLDGRAFPMRFVSAGSLGEKVASRFVECNGAIP
jgi:hypothetical protein